MQPNNSSSPSPISDWLIPLVSGPGSTQQRFNLAEKVLNSLEGHLNVATCTLVKDRRDHSSLFYAIAHRRTEFIKMILNHEANW